MVKFNFGYEEGLKKFLYCGIIKASCFIVEFSIS